MVRNIGVVLPRDLHPQEIVQFARVAESTGFSEIWVIEEAFHRGAIAQTATVLGATSSIRVGVRLLACPARNPIHSSLEIAVLARIHPGRLITGVGADPHSLYFPVKTRGPVVTPGALAAEHATTIRHLLNGGEVHAAVSTGATFSTVLEESVEEPPIVLVDAAALTETRDIDGVLLPFLASPLFVAATSTQARKRVVAYGIAAVAEVAEAAIDAARNTLAQLDEPDWDVVLAGLDFADEITLARLAAPSYRSFVAAMPDEWVEAITLAGTRERVQTRIDEMHESGATVIVLLVADSDPIDAVSRLGAVINEPAEKDRWLTSMDAFACPDEIDHDEYLDFL